ncbi:amidohydrolase family protein [Caballeronia sp. INDeC2]|uniref:amidohydrolase family protein n=1 Tax=Caballeronia sp. INDeC2 TaxID=2921747 RepID=UPI0020294CCA|nr:amidohydrolase family protein [Caballeronia sp. INDeC2]
MKQKTNQHAGVYQCGCCSAPAPGRRQFLAGSAGLAAAAMMPRLASAATAGQRMIDVHHHFEPSYKNVDGSAWSIQAAVDQLDLNGVDTAIAFAGAIPETNAHEARKRARKTNEWSTQFCVDHPGRFGLFASLPMNDVDGALAEIAYVFDVLKADGIGLVTNYQDAWLGDPKFEPIFVELNRRKAVVYVHPAQAPCCTPATLTYEKGSISAPWVEFPTNTARTILSLWNARITQRMPDIKFIFCHGGGVMPILLGRIAGFDDWKSVGPQRLAELFPQGIYAEFSKLYFECAQAYAPEAFDLVRKVVPSTHLLFGSDYSYFPVAHAVNQFKALDIPDDLRRKIRGSNAATLLPRWQT